MSSKLSSLLVQDGVVSVKRMEEAFQRQVIFGGSLDTILLEMSALDEAALQRYLHAATEISPADLGAVDFVRAQEQTRLFPKKLAEKYLIAPVEMAGGALRVLVTDPPDRGRLDELGFMLGVAIVPEIVPEFRLYQALEVIYGVKMPLRYAGLVKRLGPPPRPEGAAAPAPRHAEPTPAPQPESPRTNVPEVINAYDDPFAGAKPETLVGMPVQPIPGSAPQSSDDQDPSLGAGPGPSLGAGPGPSLGAAIPDQAAPESVVTAWPDDVQGARTPSIHGTMIGVPLRDLAEPPLPGSVAPAETLPDPTPHSLSVDRATSPAEPTEDSPALYVPDEREMPPPLSDGAAWPAPHETEAQPPTSWYGSTDDDPAVTPAQVTPTFAGWDHPPQADPALSGEPQVADLADRSARLASLTPTENLGVQDAASLTPPPEAPSAVTLLPEAVTPQPFLSAPMEEAHPSPEASRPAIADMPFDPTPLAFEEAVASLQEAENRDDIFALLLRAVAGQFEYASVFTLFGEQAVGRMDLHRGVADMEKIGQVAIPLSLPSIFRTTVESRGYYFGPLYDEGINYGVLADLERPVPMAAFIMPVLIRNRVVCFLYADNGLRPVASEVPESLVFISHQISQAFQRLILKAKRAQYSSASSATSAGDKVDLTEALPKRRRISSDTWQAAPLRTDGVSTRAPAEDGTFKEETPVQAAPSAVAPLVQPAFPELPRTGEAQGMTVSAPQPAPRLTPSSPAPPVSRDSRAITSVGFYSLTEGHIPEEVRGHVTSGEVGSRRSASGPPPSPAGAPLHPTVGESPVKVKSGILEVVSTPDTPRTEDIWSLIDDLERGGPEGDLAAAALQHLGEPAIKLVAFRFPGRLSQERMGQHGKLPPPSVHGPLVYFMVRLGERAVPYLLELLGSENPEVRYYATFAFSELHAPSALGALLDRVFDSAPLVRRITVEVFKSYQGDPALRVVLEHLRAELVGPGSFRKRCSAEVLGALRDVAAVPRLIELTADRDPETSESAQRALLLITKQAFGDSRNKWHKWWERNQARHRIQWLLDALSHKESECRFLASQELHQLTGETFGYRFDQDKRDREDAMRRWEEWWETRGKARFLS